MHGLPDPSCFHVPRFVKEENGRNVSRIDPRIRQALALLEESPVVPLSEIALKLNLSESRFRHLFKKELGICPRHYVTLIRLDLAKKLLFQVVYRK